MSAKIDFLYLSEPDMIKAGVKDMGKCVDIMEDMMVTLNKGDYVMGGENHNSHGCMVTFPDNPEFEGMPKNGEDRRFMAMPAYLGGNFQMAGMKWYGSNIENKKKGLPRSILMMMLNDKDTAMEAIDRLRETSNSHERCSVVEVMGRSAGYIALWCGIANGAEEILLPEKFDNNYDKLIEEIKNNRASGMTHQIIVNAEGIGHSYGLAKKIEEATGIETRATILGHLQRGGSPTARDRVYASVMGAYAVDCIEKGKKNRLIGYKDGHVYDIDIDEAFKMQKSIDDYEYEVAGILGTRCEYK